MQDYKEIARQARLKVLELIWKAQTSHVGSNFSCIDILTVLFEKIDLDKDKFILSKGWAAASLYYFLWRRGKITEKELNSYCQVGSKFIGLSEPIHPDIPFAGGSMGIGLPAAVGFALAKKLKREDGKVYVLMSDGEMQCGTTWESALIATRYELDNLVIILDKNGWQAMGKTDEILHVNPFLFLSTLDWCTNEIDGHNHYQIYENIINNLYHKLNHTKHKRPKIVICNTIKGKGVSFMEDNNSYHYLHVSDEDYKKALEELNAI